MTERGRTGAGRTARVRLLNAALAAAAVFAGCIAPAMAGDSIAMADGQYLIIDQDGSGYNLKGSSAATGTISSYDLTITGDLNVSTTMADPFTITFPGNIAYHGLVVEKTGAGDNVKKVVIDSNGPVSLTQTITGPTTVNTYNFSAVELNSAGSSIEYKTGNAVEIDITLSTATSSANITGLKAGTVTVADGAEVGITGTITSENATGNVFASGNTYAIQATNGNAAGAKVTIADLARSAESTSGTDSASADSNIIGVNAGGIGAFNASASDTVTITRVSQTATAAASASAKGNIIGIQSGTFGTANGTSVILSDISRTATSTLLGTADVSGTITAIGGGGDATATGQITIQNTILTAEAGAAGPATAAGSTIGVNSTTGKAKGAAVTIDTVTRTATINVLGNAYASGLLAGVYADDGEAEATGAVDISNGIFNAAIADGSGAASAAGMVMGVYAGGTGSNATAKGVRIETIDRTALSIGGVAANDADAFGEIAGVYSVDGSALADGTVLIKDVTFRAEVQDGTGSASASDDSLIPNAGTYGVFADGAAGTARATGTVTIDNVERYAESRGGVLIGDAQNASAMGQIAGVYSGDGAATAEGLVTLTNLDNTAKVAAGLGEAAASGDSVGVAGTGKVMAQAVTINKVNREAESRGNLVNDQSAYASGNIAAVSSFGDDASAAGAVAISEISSSAKVAAGTGNAEAYGAVFGVYADGVASATSTVTIDDIKRQAESRGGDAVAFGEAYGVNSNNGTANAGGAVSLTNITNTAKVATGLGEAYAGGDTVGVLGVGKTTAQAVTITNINHEAESRGDIGDGKDADASGRIAGVYSWNGEASAAGAVTISSANLSAKVLAGEGGADASGSVYGVHAGLGNGSAASTVTIDGIERYAESRDDGANAYGTIAGIYADGGTAVATGAVEIKNMTSTAKALTDTGSAYADVSGDTYGVYTDGANALAQAKDNVLIQDITRKAETNGGGAYADSFLTGVASGSGAATADKNVSIYRVTTDAKVAAGTGEAYANNDVFGVLADGDGGAAATVGGNVTIQTVTATAASRGDNASAHAVLGGAVSMSGDASVAGTVTLTGLQANAGVTGAGDANAGGNAYGVYAHTNGKASAGGDVAVTGINRTANAANGSAIAGGYDIDFAAVPAPTAMSEHSIAGVMSRHGDASAAGSVTVQGSSTANAAGAGNYADARLKGYGVYAGRDASVAGDISVTTISSASAANPADAYQYGLAVGAAAGRTLDMAATVKTIDAHGTTYAAGLFLRPDYEDPAFNDSQARTINMNGPAVITATADSQGDNDYISYERTHTDGFSGTITIAEREALPVREAEFLGLGKNDTVNLNFGNGKTMDNGGEALRFFGMETVNLNSGTLALADGSYFMNQRDFDTTAGAAFGTVNGGMRTATVNAAAGTTLRIDGVVKSELTRADGAHTDRFGTIAVPGGDQSFDLDKDYALNLNFTDAQLAVGAEGDMSMTNLTQTGASGIIFEVASDGNGGLTAGTLDVTGTATLTKDVSVTPVDVFSVAPGTTVDHALLTYGNGSGIQSSYGGFDGLFYDYSINSHDNALWLEFNRNDNTVSSVVGDNGGNVNVQDLADGLDGFDYKGTALEPFMDQIANLPAGGQGALDRALRQMTGELASTAVLAGMEAHRNMLGLNGNYLFGSHARLNKDAVSLDELTCGEVVSPCLAPASAWRVRAMASWNRLNLSGSDGFSPYRSTNRTILLAGEHARGGLTLGLAGAIGWTKTRDRDFGSEAKSDDYGLVAYGRYDFDQLFVAGRFGFSYSDIDTTRRMPFMNDTASGDFSAKYYSAGLFVGHDFNFRDGWTVTATAGAAWQKAHARAFTERGSALALNHSSWNMNSFEGQLDFEVAKTFAIGCGDASITPRVNVGMAYEFADRGAGGRSSFANMQDFPSFRAETSRVGRLKTLVGAGVDWRITRNLGISVEYEGSFRRRAVEHGGRVGVSWTW